MRVGERIKAVLTCTGITHYTCRDWDREKDKVVWRYSFRDADRRGYVYSGVQLGIRNGETVRMRGTVKRLEPEYSQTRLSRVKITERGLQSPML